MSEIWEATKADTTNICGTEINAGNNLVDESTQTAFDKAQKNISKQAGLFKPTSWELGNAGKEIQKTLKERGASACADIAKALEGTSYKKFSIQRGSIPEQKLSSKAQELATETKPNIQTAFQQYGNPTQRLNKQMREAGLE